MKKTLVFAAVASAFAGAAHAQSSVTLYGLIDAGLAYTNNVGTANGKGSRWAATSGNVNGSRWGLRGSEDLGNGLKAIFVLENGFSINNGQFGQNSRMFGRQAYVGLSSNQWGQLTLGRQYDSLVDYLGPLALTGTGYGGTTFAHPLDNDNLNNSFRVNNSVKFSSANYNGFKIGALYGFSNEAGGFSDNRAYSVGASYNWAGFNFAAAYLQTNNRNSLNTSGAVTDDYTGAIASGRQRVYGAGVNYAFGPAVVGFVFTQSKHDDATGISGVDTFAGIENLRFNNYEVNARYNLTPAWNISGEYTYTDARVSGANVGDYKPKFHTFGLMSTYALSKRTDVYVQGVYQKVSSGEGLGAYINGSGGMSTTDKQVVVTTGVRHRF